MTALEFIAEAAEWRNLLEKAIGALDAEAFKLGLTFEPSHNPAYLDGSIAPVNPRYLPGRLSARNFVHIMGSGGNPEHLQTRQALRVYNWYDGATLASESRALRVYYDHEEDAGHREYAIYSHPIADRIHGRVAFNGAVWVAPDLRGPRSELNGAHVSQIISPLSRLFALYLYDVDWCIATTKEALVLKQVTDRYGWAGVEPGLKENIGSIGGETDCWLMWSRREDILKEAERIIEKGVGA